MGTQQLTDEQTKRVVQNAIVFSGGSNRDHSDTETLSDAGLRGTGFDQFQRQVGRWGGG